MNKNELEWFNNAKERSEKLSLIVSETYLESVQYLLNDLRKSIQIIEKYIVSNK